jgi:hypothetical protein
MTRKEEKLGGANSLTEKLNSQIGVSNHSKVELKPRDHDIKIDLQLHLIVFHQHPRVRDDAVCVECLTFCVRFAKRKKIIRVNRVKMHLSSTDQVTKREVYSFSRFLSTADL